MKKWGMCFLGMWLLLQGAFAGSETGPQETQHARLSAQLQVYQAISETNQWAALPAGTCLQLGDTGVFVSVLRRNLMLTGDLPAEGIAKENTLFDELLKLGVQSFQRRHGLLPDGKVGQETLAELNVSPARRVQQIELNLDRWRAFYSAPAQPMVFVNIPDYTLQLLDENYQTIWQTAVVVGQVGKAYQTVPLEGLITYLVFNPTWTVPQSIIRREIVPMMKKDPRYLQRNNMEVYREDGTKRSLIPASQINWATADPEKDNFWIVQRAGAGNALGKVKFMFPNQHAIYLHDTPARSLFSQRYRAYSHGCVRVQYPEQLAAFLLSDDWQKPLDISPYLASTESEKVVRLPTAIPVRLGYFTCWVDDAGQLQFRKDIYKLDVVAPEAVLVL